MYTIRGSTNAQRSNEYEKEKEKDKVLINNYQILFNKKKYYFIINQIDDKIQFIIINKDFNSYTEYKNELNCQDFIDINEYFRKFDNINQISKELIKIVEENNLEIVNETENTIEIKLIIMPFLENNIIKINLTKVKNEEKEKEKDKIDILYDVIKDIKINLENKDKRINDLEIEINKLKEDNITLKRQFSEELNKKEEKIKSLENNFDELKRSLNEKNISRSTCLYMSSENRKTRKRSLFENVLRNSNIFENDSEIILLLSNIPNSKHNIKLIYNSNIDKENEQKLIESYIGKNDLIFLIKTDKLRRFGGYAHESFEKNKFKKTDNRAFLFNLNDKTIYKSKGRDCSIWRDSNICDSINFGIGEDLKIFHNFLKKKSKAHQGNKDYDYKSGKSVLNSDEDFNISSLEIFQVFLNE
jgi:hypothetical protein